MKLGLLFILFSVVLTVAGCVVEPYGRGGYYDHGQQDYGRRVWHE